MLNGIYVIFRKHSSVPDLFCKVLDEEDGKLFPKIPSMLSKLISKNVNIELFYMPELPFFAHIVN